MKKFIHISQATRHYWEDKKGKPWFVRTRSMTTRLRAKVSERLVNWAGA